MEIWNISETGWQSPGQPSGREGKVGPSLGSIRICSGPKGPQSCPEQSAGAVMEQEIKKTWYKNTEGPLPSWQFGYKDILLRERVEEHLALWMWSTHQYQLFLGLGSGPHLPYSLPQVLPVSLMTKRENVFIWAEFAAIEKIPKST